MKTKFFLTGFRGSGKTTLAKLLAEKLNFQAIEMDKLIVKRAGKSIAEITENGKDWHDFRLLENQVLKDLLKKEKFVAATGGGLFINPIRKDGVLDIDIHSEKQGTGLSNGVNDIEFSPGITFGQYNYNLVKDLPGKLIIFLKVNEEVLKKRLSQPEFRDYNKNFRPSLTGSSKIDIEEEVEIYRNRLLFYEKRADIILDTSSQEPEESLREILKLL